MVVNKFIKFFSLIVLSLLTLSCGTINRINKSNTNITVDQKIERYIERLVEGEVEAEPEAEIFTT